LYAFTDLPTNANDKLGIAKAGPSMEFAEWVPGRSFAPESRAKKLARNPSKKKAPLRKAERQHFDNRNVTATKSGELENSAAPKVEAVIPGSNGRKAAPVLASKPIAH
jgi:hypothetical protein